MATPSASSGRKLIRRRATGLLANGTRETRWLDEWREFDAYVLLGDPGAGKSWSLASEAAAAGQEPVHADLVQAGLVALAGGDVAFIDAIDEARGSGGRDAIASIARQLLTAGRPSFRLACREADWRDEADQRLLEAVAPSGRVLTLHLEPLDRDDILAVLADHADAGLADPAEFLAQADRHGVGELLGNPLLLDLLVQAVLQHGGAWPSSRAAVSANSRRPIRRAFRSRLGRSTPSSQTPGSSALCFC